MSYILEGMAEEVFRFVKPGFNLLETGLTFWFVAPAQNQGTHPRRVVFLGPNPSNRYSDGVLLGSNIFQRGKIKGSKEKILARE